MRFIPAGLTALCPTVSGLPAASAAPIRCANVDTAGDGIREFRTFNEGVCPPRAVEAEEGGANSRLLEASLKMPCRLEDNDPASDGNEAWPETQSKTAFKELQP